MGFLRFVMGIVAFLIAVKLLAWLLLLVGIVFKLVWIACVFGLILLIAWGVYKLIAPQSTVQT